MMTNDGVERPSSRSSSATNLVGYRVGRRFRYDDDEIGRRILFECFERFIVFSRNVLHAAGRLQQRVLGANAGVVEAGRDRVRLLHLPIVVLQDHRV